MAGSNDPLERTDNSQLQVPIRNEPDKANHAQYELAAVKFDL